MAFDISSQHSLDNLSQYTRHYLYLDSYQLDILSQQKLERLTDVMSI